MPLLRGEGIVLRSMNLGEWDRLLVILAVGLGKVKVVAKGARKVQSRYASSTQPFTHMRFSSYSGKTFYTLSQVEVIESYRPLRESLDKMAYGLYLMELVDLSLIDGQRHDDILSLLLASLHILSHSERYELLLMFFELRWLSRLGFALSMEQAAKVSREAKEMLYLLRQGSWQKIEELPRMPKSEEEVSSLLDQLVRERVDKTPESFRFLAEVRRGAR